MKSNLQVQCYLLFNYARSV